MNLDQVMAELKEKEKRIKEISDQKIRMKAQLDSLHEKKVSLEKKAKSEFGVDISDLTAESERLKSEIDSKMLQLDGMLGG